MADPQISVGVTQSFTNGQVPFFVSRQTSLDVLQWPRVIERLRAAYTQAHEDACHPRRSVARDGKSWIRAMACIPPVGRYMGVKAFGLGPDKKVNYAIILVERESGLIAGVVDGAPITAMRTAATSAVAVDKLAPKDASVLGVLGSGDEAFAHVQAIAQVRPISQLRVYSPTAARREQFAQHFADTLNIESTAVASPEAATDGARIVVAAARSRDETPILHARCLASGMTVVSIGSTLPEQRELDISVIDACDLLVCDAVEEVCMETGDMLAAKRAGVSFADKTISLNTLLSRPTVAADVELPLFKSVGSALQDIVVAELALEAAIEAGAASSLSNEFYIKHA